MSLEKLKYAIGDVRKTLTLVVEFVVLTLDINGLFILYTLIPANNGEGHFVADSGYILAV